MVILITGATSGFGKATAEKFAANGWHCIITGRRKEKLAAVAEELSSTFNVKVLPLVFDVRNKEEVNNHLQNLPDEWKQIDVLYNNAGGAWGRDSFENGLVEDYETMIDTNLNGLLYVTKAVLPYMIANKKGMLLIWALLLLKTCIKTGMCTVPLKQLLTH